MNLLLVSVPDDKHSRCHSPVGFLYLVQRKKKDAGAPKRPMSAYMMWLNASRERIKSENPGISITEISKKAGEMWRQLGKDEKEVNRNVKKETRGCAGSPQTLTRNVVLLL